MSFPKHIYFTQTNDPTELNRIFSQLMERFDTIEASIGTTSSSSSSTTTTTAATSANDLIYIRDEKTSGTDGGASLAKTWNTRDLNTIVNDEGSYCSLSSNRFTLDAGTYRVFITVPNERSGVCKARLYNYTNSSTQLVGKSSFSQSSYGATTLIVQGEITITEQATFFVQHYTEDAYATGLGRAASTEEKEVYTEVWLEKIG